MVYADSLRAEDFAAAVEKVVAMPESKREKLLKAAYLWQQGFTWQRVSEQMAQIYEKVAGET